METKLLTTDDESLKIAAEILKDGGNVIFPTETVYGLGADALNPEAVKNIFEAKGRPADNPLIVHISSIDMLKDIVEEVPENAKQLVNKYWPGPLTVILKKCKNVPYETTAGLDTVAVRMPVNQVARRLIELADMPIAAPSANLSGKPSPTTAQHCIDDMVGRVDAIIEGEDCKYGVESTVVDLSGEKPILYRPGAVTLEELEEVLGEVEVSVSAKENETPKSPGLKYKHYSPNANVVILAGEWEQVEGFIKAKTDLSRIGMLVFDEFPKIDGVKCISLGSLKNPYDAMHKLFWALREMDKMGVMTVYAPEIADKGAWRAVRNRLYRAAGNEIINLSKGDAKKVLFVCTGNTCRSPMAEAIFNKICKEKNINAKAESAGVYADGSLVSTNAAEAIKEYNIDISERVSKNINKDMIENTDLILTMSASHKMALNYAFGDSDKIYTIAEYIGENQDVADPFGGSLEDYKSCRDMLYSMIEKVTEKI